jgi:hypothetical protein
MAGQFDFTRSPFRESKTGHPWPDKLIKREVRFAKAKLAIHGRTV